MALTKLERRARIKQRIRKVITGTTVKPRLSVFRSNNEISAQLIDDEAKNTVAAATSVGKKLDGTMTDKAAKIGTEIAKKAKKVKINEVVFDRNGRQYAGRLKALADAARKEGLEF